METAIKTDTYTVEFFDLANGWYDSMNVEATSTTNAKDIARKMLGRGFVRFHCVG
jgi:hypothetical protein